MFARLSRTFKLLSKHHFIIHRSNILWRLPRFKAEYIKFIQSGGAIMAFGPSSVIDNKWHHNNITTVWGHLYVSQPPDFIRYIAGYFPFYDYYEGNYVFLSIKLYLDVGRGENMYISHATLMPVSWAVWTYNRGSVASGAGSPGRRKRKNARSE